MLEDLSKLHIQFKRQSLNRSDLDDNPISQFKKWLEEALSSKINDPTAMTLATVGKNGNPSARIVLLKSIDEEGFSFFTNYTSRKGSELISNPNAALVFYWPELERQIRVEGSVKVVDAELSNKYFNSRPEQSRISAIISPQSKPIPNRDFLEKKIEEFIAGKRELTRPENWGGFILEPTEIEFWQGRENRLHDRFKYTREEKSWHIERLAP